MKKLQIILGITALVCLLSVIISSLCIYGVAGSLDCQRAVSRWVSDGTPYAQLSAFLTDDAGVDRERVERSFTASLDSALVDASIAAQDEDARIYAYCFSSEADGSVSLKDEWGKVQKSGVSVRISAVGADYFIFHPSKLLSGYYFNTADVLNDCVIIDNDLAWQLFGSYDVVGRSFTLNGRDVYISGVSESGRDGDYEKYYGDKSRILISYSLAEELFGGLSITAVELLLPNPIDGFALDIFTDALGVPEGKAVLLENSSRFSDKSLRAHLASFSEHGVRTDSVVYPYFENTAMELMNRAALIYIFKLVPTVIIILIIALELIILYIKRRVLIARVRDFMGKKLRDFRQNREVRKQLKSAKGDFQ